MIGPDPSELFRQEAQELLEQLEQSLLDLSDRQQDQDLIDSTFRALHTIKGSGSMFGFDAVAATGLFPPDTVHCFLSLAPHNARKLQIKL